ncbi:MAG: hypothetical protein KF681_10170 [Bdellovibrionaceae bacterium]|nr:hypothetical protein [Pseudobdellovibrionaceae bacterium]
MFSISAIFDKSWNGIKDQLALTAGLTLVYLVGITAIAMTPFIGSFLSAPFTAGYMICLLKIRRNEDIEYRDVFWGFQNFNRFAQLLLAGFLVGALTVVATIFFILPGIWFIIASSFTTAYMVLNDTDAVTALKKSLAAVKGRWWHIFVFMMALGLLALAGAICFFIGLLVTIPLVNMMTLTAAEELEEYARAGATPTSPGTPGSGPSVMTVNPS